MQVIRNGLITNNIININKNLSCKNNNKILKREIKKHLNRLNLIGAEFDRLVKLCECSFLSKFDSLDGLGSD